MKLNYFFKNIFSDKNSGQVMLLAVLLITSSVLVFTSIAGYLMIGRLKMASNIVDSTKAIMAADAGIECELFNKYKNQSIICSNIVFDDSKTGVSTTVNASGTKSIGASNKFKRAFYTGF